jgi:Lysylphosphatidylglycerol synthase TM region
LRHQHARDIPVVAVSAFCSELHAEAPRIPIAECILKPATQEHIRRLHLYAAKARNVLRVPPDPIFASCLQLVTLLLDAATLWMLIRSLGATVHFSHVFASFMIANLARTVSFIPGGLGTFEAAAVLMLKIDGVSVAVVCPQHCCFEDLHCSYPWLRDYGFLAASTGIALRSMEFSVAQNPNALGTFAGCELFLHLASRRLSSASTNIGMLKSRGVRRPMQACFALDWRSAC